MVLNMEGSLSEDEVPVALHSISGITDRAHNLTPDLTSGYQDSSLSGQNISTQDCLNSDFPSCIILSYVADPPRGFASCYLEKVMKRQWGSRRDTSII